MNIYEAQERMYILKQNWDKLHAMKFEIDKQIKEIDDERRKILGNCPILDLSDGKTGKSKFTHEEIARWGDI